MPVAARQIQLYLLYPMSLRLSGPVYRSVATFMQFYPCKRPPFFAR
jgi:hypothetical protein